MKKSVLINVSYIVEVEGENNEALNKLLDKITHSISENVTINSDVQLKWEGTSSVELDEKNVNCGRCSNCGGWVTDREKPNYIEGLCDGATHDGKLLCDECLPSDHRWAFSLWY